MSPTECPDCLLLIPDAAPACLHCGYRVEPSSLSVTALPPQMPVLNGGSRETIIHQDHVATITTARVVFGAITYPVRNITSVRITINRPKYGGAITLLAVGGFCALIGMGGVLLFYLLAIIFCGIGAWGIYSAKPLYQLKVGNAGTEFVGTISHSLPYIEHLHTALNHAIVNFR